MQLTSDDNRRKSTLGVGVADVAVWTHTLGIVADNRTESIGATGAWTRVTALLTDAGKSQWAVTAHNALRSTLDIRVASVPFQTRADGMVA